MENTKRLVPEYFHVTFFGKLHFKIDKIYHSGGVHVYVNLDTRRQVVVFQFTKLPSDVWTPIYFLN